MNNYFMQARETRSPNEKVQRAIKLESIERNQNNIFKMLTI
jgi:hypothetical protein